MLYPGWDDHRVFIFREVAAGGQWVRGACRSCTFFLLTVCTLADSARCFSGHMANDNPVHSFFVVTVDTWAGVCCAVPADITHSRSILSHSIFIFAEVPGKSLTRPIFFKRLHSFIAPFFIYFYYQVYVNFTVQSSALYVVDLSPPIRQGLGSLALLQENKKRDSLPPLQRCWTR